MKKLFLLIYVLSILKISQAQDFSGIAAEAKVEATKLLTIFENNDINALNSYVISKENYIKMIDVKQNGTEKAKNNKEFAEKYQVMMQDRIQQSMKKENAEYKAKYKNAKGATIKNIKIERKKNAGSTHMCVAIVEFEMAGNTHTLRIEGLYKFENHWYLFAGYNLQL